MPPRKLAARRSRTPPPMPPHRRSTDIDLAGGFRLDLKTGLLLLALAAQWWDMRAQEDKRAEVQKIRDESAVAKMVEFNNRLVEIQAYLSNLKASLAAAGVADVDGKPIRR